MSNGDGLGTKLGKVTGCEETGKTDLGKPGDAAECSHTAEDESESGGNGDKHSSACAVGRDCVQPNRDSQDTGAADEDPVCEQSAKFELVHG